MRALPPPDYQQPREPQICLSLSLAVLDLMSPDEIRAFYSGAAEQLIEMRRDLRPTARRTDAHRS